MKKEQELISEKIKNYEKNEKFEKNNESYFEESISRIKKEHLNIEFNKIDNLISEFEYNY